MLSVGREAEPRCTCTVPVCDAESRATIVAADEEQRNDDGEEQHRHHHVPDHQPDHRPVAVV